MILILVLPLNLIAIIQANIIIGTMEEQTRKSLQSFAETYIAQVGVRMANAQSLLYYFLSDSDFIIMKLQEENTYVYQSMKYKFVNRLKNMASMTDSADGYFYYIKKLNDLIIYDNNPSESKHVYQLIRNFTTEQSDYGGKTGWHIYQSNEHQYLLFIAKMKDDIYGGWINLDPLKAKIEKELDYSDFSVSFSEEKEDLIDKETIIVSSGTKGIYLNIYLNRAVITGKISVYQKVLQIMVFLYLALVPALYVFLRFLLILPLKKINYAHRQIQSGNQNYRIVEKANSVEYREAYQSFNQMADNLKSLKLENYEKEIAKQKMELRNLQLQIRPHFLLNTFNLIYTLAQRKEIAAIQDIIIYLSDYFRYIIRHDSELELFRNELKLIEGYIKMVSIRYSGNIELNCEIEPQVMYVRVPPLLIHNFVENSVKHGFKQGKILYISIIGKYEDNMVTFYIKDNGIGMDETKLEKIRKLLSGDIEICNLNSHIGLLNSMKRLKYYYGEEANIEIFSKYGEITCVKVQFPYSLEVEVYDETINGQ